MVKWLQETLEEKQNNVGLIRALLKINVFFKEPSKWEPWNQKHIP